MNTGEDFVIERIVEFQPLALNISFDTSLVSNNPALESMYKEVLIARQNKEIEIASLLPELNIGYFNQSLIGTQSVNGNEVHFGIGDRFHGVNLGINVPLTFFNSSSKIQSLDFKQQSLLREADNVRIQLQNQLRNAYVQYEQILSQYKYYSSTALLNSEVIINTAKVSFQSGEIDYIEFLQALETVTDVHLAYLNCINQLNQSVINITSLINK